MKSDGMNLMTDNNLGEFAGKLRAPRTKASKNSGTGWKWAIWSLVSLLVILGVLIKLHAPPPMEFADVTEERSGAINKSLLRVGGYANYDRVVDIGTEERGPIEQSMLIEGRRFKQGSVLAVLKNNELKVELAIRKKKLGDSMKERNRMKKLFVGGAASEADNERAENDFRQSELDLQMASVRLQNSYIKAPFDGVVIEKYVEVGALVEGRIARFGDTSVLVVEIDVNQNDIHKLGLNQPSIITLDAFPGLEYAGEVLRIYPRGDKAKNTVPVKVKVLFPDKRFRPQMSSKVYFVDRPVAANDSAKTDLVVSERAVSQEGDRSFIWKKQGDVLVKREVRLGEVRENGVTLLSGVEPNDQVLLDPSKRRLRDGAPVRTGSSFSIFDLLHH